MGKNLDKILSLVVLASLLHSFKAMNLLKEINKPISNYNPLFSPRYVKKIKNLKYARNPLYHRNFGFYQRKTY